MDNPRRHRSAFDFPAGFEEHVAKNCQGDVDREQENNPKPERYVRLTDETVTETGNRIVERIGMADCCEGGRQLVYRIERA